MSTLVRDYRGRVVFRSRDPLPPRAPRTVTVKPEHDPHPLPHLAPLPEPQDDVHAVDGVTYRVVDRFQATDGWASAETVLGWFGLQTFEQFTALIGGGAIDAAVLRHSGTRRFRVLDTARCERIAQELLGNPPGARAPSKSRAPSKPRK